ncbi:MAG: bifunctional homocysteine S-methyltransferase/methylenetetrahydrofolate reductase [Alphaproteobacteria bacterium]|nr:bifunctional homocysteine S-methyltransferase/methylenetetrahydrofolate reductase [Alphaproteobacteria bacterium]
MTRFLERLSQGVIVADGGMGSMIHQLADPGFHVPDQVNLTQPDLVLKIHVRFLRAGARLIETNSFGSNRMRLARIGLADQVSAINGKAVKLAREAREIAGVDAFIGGSIGPSGLRIDRSDDQRAHLDGLFREQALALDDRGVDLFVLETFTSPWELQTALAAVKAVSGLPVVAQLALPPGDEWSEPDDADVDAETLRDLEALAALDADVIGLNCSMGPGQLIPYFKRLAALAPGRPLALQPNSGLPRREGGRFIYPSTEPGYYTAFAREAADAGARVIGGCCGTTPEQIKAIADALAEWRPGSAQVVVGPPVVVPADAPRKASAPGGLAGKLAAGQFVVSMQVDPPKGTSSDMVLEACRTFRDSGLVDVVDVNSNPMARLHMDALWMSARIQREGVDTIAHYTPRDASLMGIQGNLLGAWEAGVRNVLVITGDPSMVRGEPGAVDVYQTDAIGMVRAIRRLNEGRDVFGNTVGEAPDFTIGVAVNPNAPDLDRELDRYKAKIDAGAQFAMTQVFFEWGCWERFLDRLGGRSPIPVLVAVWPLTSHRLALRLHHEVPGIIVPDPVLARLERAGPKARDEGFAIGREMLAGARERAEGVYVIAPFKRPVAALELFEER